MKKCGKMCVRQFALTEKLEKHWNLSLKFCSYVSTVHGRVERRSKLGEEFDLGVVLLGTLTKEF